MRLRGTITTLLFFLATLSSGVLPVVDSMGTTKDFSDVLGSEMTAAIAIVWDGGGVDALVVVGVSGSSVVDSSSSSGPDVSDEDGDDGEGES